MQTTARSAFLSRVVSPVRWALVMAAVLAVAGPVAGETLPGLGNARRVVVLGDSITYSGQYVDDLDAYVSSRFPTQRVEFLNLGLPSETVSGLSEPGHAGGQFPRPCLHERLQRVLAKTRPDFVIACYGMNDGIYYPFGEDRFEAFQNGIRKLREQVLAAGAKLLLVTPPVFDPLPIKDRTLPAGRAEYRSPYVGYNEVLDRYSAWLLSQRSNGWDVVDVHGPMNQFLAEHRKQDPTYSLSRDGVHMNATGHWLAAQQILLHLGAAPGLRSMRDPAAMLANLPGGAEFFALIELRQRILKDAWLTDVGHNRPGMKRGLPLPEAEAQAAELEPRILALAAGAPPPEIRRENSGLITISDAGSNAIVRYTLDGSDPGRDAGQYLAPIALPRGGTVKARVFGAKSDFAGPVTSASFPPTAPAQPASGAVNSAVLPVTQNRDWRTYDWVARHAAVKALLHSRRPELVFIGDSITHFFGGEPHDAPARGAEVWQRFYGRRNAVNLGFGWDRTENVLWRLEHGELDDAAPKVIVLLIGTNNLERNSVEEIAAGIRAICESLHARLPQTKILLLGILPRSPQPDPLRAKLAELNQRIASLDGQDGVTYLDIGARFVNADGSISREVMSDFLHPTARGYEMFSEAIEPTLARLLGEATAGK